MKVSGGLSVPQLPPAPLAILMQYCVFSSPGQQSSLAFVILEAGVACPVISAVMLEVSKKCGNFLELIAGPRNRRR